MLKISQSYRPEILFLSRKKMASSSERNKRHLLAGRLSIDRLAIFHLIHELSLENEEFFDKNNNSHMGVYNERMLAVYERIRKCVDILQKNILVLQDIAPKYDYDERTPGNGYRSLVCICDTVLLHVVFILKTITEQRQSFVFRQSHYCKELESYATVIDYLNAAIPLTMESEKNLDESLFPSLDGNYDGHQKVLSELEKLDSSVFYGRPLGFQFCPSITRIFRVIGVVLATYSLSWEKGHGPIGSIINSGRFFLSPEQRASRIIKVTKEADIDFCKGFWNLTELSNNMPKFFCPNMAVNELREIPWKGPIPMSGVSGETIMVPEPSAHTGIRPVSIRVLSPVHRTNMSSSPLSTPLPPSSHLILHCHGGGYVATSSKSHETYLRQWAKALNCTVVSVEYSLAPENPFPRPTEEVLFAYSWIINNPAAVGWTGERIVMAGDSAGGNLIMSVNLRLLQLGIRRKPDGLVLCYTPFLFQYLPSPSRMLSVMDPLLHMGVVLRCVAAYTGGYSAKKEHDDKVVAESSHRSLQEYVNEVQKTQVDFAGGSQSIVSLVQKSHDNTGFVNPIPISCFKRKDDKKQGGSCETTLEEEEGEEEEAAGSDDDDALETTSIASVQINSDPFHIQLSSSLYDGQLIDYLSNHPTTKNALTICSSNGSTSDDDDLEIGEDALEGHETETAEPMELKTEPLKRPRLLQLISGVTSSQTAPNTPHQPPKQLPSSTSVNNFQQTPVVQHKRSLSQSLADTAASTAAYAFDNLQDWLERPQRERQKLDRTNSHKEDVLSAEEEAKKKPNVLDLISQTTVPRDPLISPLYASNEMIRQLPPCYFLGCHLDPLLDDTIAFATKLRNAGGEVASVDLLSAVPHGFLNFTLISPECKKAGKVCIKRLKQSLGIPLDATDE